MTHPTDDEIMKLAGEWFHTGENQKRDDGYYYRSLGTPSNVRGSDLIEFARALLAEQARTEPDSFTLLARVRDALPVPERGSPLEQLWAAAMADPGSVPEYVRASLAQTHKAEDAPSDAELLDSRGNIRSDLKSSAYCVGNEYKPFHPSASHVRPEWRDGWNACFVAAIAQERKA